MRLVEKRHEFFVVVQDVTSTSIGPVNVDLIGIHIFMSVVFIRSLLDPHLAETIRHQEKTPNIVPLQPEWEE